MARIGPVLFDAENWRFAKCCAVLIAFETIFRRVPGGQSLSCHPTKALNRRLISSTIAPMHQPYFSDAAE